MLTVLSKTQEFLNEESINTNPRYNKVEEFICLNPKVIIFINLELCFIGDHRLS